MMKGVVSYEGLVEVSSFVQLKSQGQEVPQLKSQERVAQFLQSRAGQLKSRVLAALAVRVAEDPFVKVVCSIGSLCLEKTDSYLEHPKGYEHYGLFVVHNQFPA